MALRRGGELQVGGKKAAAFLGGNVGEAGAVRVLFEHRLEPGLETGLRLRSREVREKAAEDLASSGCGGPGDRGKRE